MSCRKLYLPLVLAFSLVLLSCDSDDDDGDALPGSFNITISGDYSAEFSGQALFATGTDPSTGQSGFALVLSENDITSTVATGNVIYIGNGSDAVLDEGIYSFTNSDQGRLPSETEVVGFFLNSSGTASVFFSADGGTLRITGASDNQLEGDVNFTATGFDSSDPQSDLTVTVTGAFTAVGGSYFGIPINP